ncbi:hypothetical protein AVEN_73351-1 [Araneus ventricosus]|uniref:Uncharacterized protein n=1 Tax=Araneus ventricosus TaxID=182803 RepID=A0A4Y2VYX3_ARAVE|nr:hypothetical protein AVEN_73351-1 [Araneus ventricosus]
MYGVHEFRINIFCSRFVKIDLLVSLRSGSKAKFDYGTLKIIVRYTGLEFHVALWSSIGFWSEMFLVRTPIPPKSLRCMLAPLNPGGIRSKRHELESPKLGGHLPHQTLTSPQKKPTASNRPSSLLRGNF